MADPKVPVHLRAATIADLAAIAALEGCAFAEPWTADQLAGSLAGTGALAWLATTPEDLPVGYALFRQVADEAELLRVATAPAWRRRQVAQGLLRRALAEFDRAGIACHLEVRADNLPAQALYQRLGFDLAGLRKGYYPDHGDAWLYVRRAGG